MRAGPGDRLPFFSFNNYKVPNTNSRSYFYFIFQKTWDICKRRDEFNNLRLGAGSEFDLLIKEMCIVFSYQKKTMCIVLQIITNQVKERSIWLLTLVIIGQ